MSMEKSIDAAQFVHRLLISACATLVFFGLAAQQPSEAYKRALAELNRVEFAFQSTAKAARDVSDRHYTSRGLLRIIGEELPGIPLPAQVHAVNLPGRPAALKPASAKADALYEYFSRGDFEQSVELYAFDEPRLRRGLKAALKNRPVRRIERVTVRRDGPSEAGVGVVSVVLHARDSAGIVRRIPVRASATTESRELPLNLDSLYAGLELTAAGGASADPLPALLAVWDEIGELPLQSVRPFLARQAERERTAREADVSLMGITVNSRLITFAGPSLVLLFLAYLLAHLLHLNKICTPRTARALEQSPWMGVYTNWFGELLAYASVTVLPAGAVWLIAGAEPGRAPDQAGWWAGVVLAVGIVAAWQIKRLNDTCAIKPADDGPSTWWGF